jgi:hypothetical protein
VLSYNLRVTKTIICQFHDILKKFTKSYSITLNHVPHKCFFKIYFSVLSTSAGCAHAYCDSDAVLLPQVVRMLIVIVVLFGSLWLPYRIVVVYNSFQDNMLQFKDSWFWLFCRTMVFINSAINPIVYNMLSVKFRRAFRDIVCKGQTLSALIWFCNVYVVSASPPFV